MNGKAIKYLYKWKYISYLCGRYTRAFDLDFFFCKNEGFIRGLKENICKQLTSN